MRESFIFHAEYIDDLPEEFKSVFAMYAINYGIYEREPSLSGLESALWTKIKRRIDHDKNEWESIKNKRSEAGKKGGVKSAESRSTAKQEQANEAMLNQNEANEAMLNQNEAKASTAKQEQANEAVNVFVNVNEFVNDDDDDDDNVGESPENLPPPPPILSEPQGNYSKIVFEKFKNAGLPCQNGDFFKFQSCDFRLALQKLKGYHHNDILTAINNYIAELKNPDSYVNQEYSFDNFIGTKTFSKCLPSNYRPQNFKIFASKIPKAEEQAERHFYEKCLKCGVKMMEWKNPLQKYKCDSCGSTFSWEEVDNATEHYIVP